MWAKFQSQGLDGSHFGNRCMVMTFGLYWHRNEWPLHPRRAILPEIRVIMAPTLPQQVSSTYDAAPFPNLSAAATTDLIPPWRLFPFLLLYRSDKFRTFTTNNSPPAFSPKYFFKKNTVLISFRNRKTFLHLFSQQIQICFWRICESETNPPPPQTAGYLLSNMRFLVFFGKRCFWKGSNNPSLVQSFIWHEGDRI